MEKIKLTAFCGCNGKWEVDENITVNPSQLTRALLQDKSLGMCPVCKMYQWYDAYYENNKILKEEIESCEKQFYEIHRKLLNLKSKCSHKFVGIGKGLFNKTAKCEICGAHGGWFCSFSPDGRCDYTQEDGSYDDDSCRYCDEPEERK